MVEKKRILLVDDEEAVTKALRLYLERIGRYEVRAENDSAKALRTAQAFRPHLILLDVHMPDIDGGEVAARLAQDGVLSGVPIVFLTGLVSPEEVDSIGKEIAGRPVLAKPVSAKDLLACIEANVA